VLEAGLRAAGEDVDAIALKDFKAGAFPSGYDIVHVHHMSKMAVMQALLFCPMVFTPHSSTYGTTVRRRSVERIVWNRSDGIVCLSENERRDKVARFPKLAHKISVIPNGIPAMASEHTPKLRQWKHGEEFTISVVGQLIDLKRPELAVQALTELPKGVRLEFTYHNNEKELQLKSLAKELGVSDQVSFLGQASGTEIYRRYARSHLLLVTSYAEALPSVVSEALITGCPVVATDEAGILVDRDAATYAAAINRAMDNYKELAREAQARGYSLEEECSPERMARRHIELYNKILEAR
jgi:glycosyltransferase involved in cell wall biosynthesis